MSALRIFVGKVTPKILKKMYRKITSPSTKEIFTKIKNNNLWGSAESISGVGSEITQTQVLINELPKLFKSKNIKSILDIPCGDFNWMRKVDLSTIGTYIGADIVDELISENNEKYRSEHIKFITLDIITDNLPKVDLIFVRDCFIHLSNSEVKNAVNNIKKSGCKYLLTTTFINNYGNHDILTGYYRPINLLHKPFNFPEPEFLLTENSTIGKHKDKAMGLWLIEKL